MKKLLKHLVLLAITVPTVTYAVANINTTVSNPSVVAPPEMINVANKNKIYGFQDYRGALSQSATNVTIRTSCCDIGVGPIIIHIDVFKDTITFMKSKGKIVVYFAGLGFIKQNPINGTNEVTTVYGIDLNPNGRLGPMTGFNQINPEMLPTSNETLISRAGKEYTAKTKVMTIEELRRTFPKHDIDAHFYMADPSSLVIVSTAVVPSFEFSPFHVSDETVNNRVIDVPNQLN